MKSETVETLRSQVTTAIETFLPLEPIKLTPNERLTGPELARFVDHTLLKPQATAVQIETLCAEADAQEFASVCLNPAYIPLAKSRLTNPAVKICTVVGFPLGANMTAVKQYETEQAITAGATEIDMVLPIGALKAGDYLTVYQDIAAVVTLAHGRGAIIVKVIIETSLLTNEEKVAACYLAKLAQADFVKTSTGFSTGGATIDDILLMRAVVGPDMGVKASGGLRNRADALAMIAAGATRLGTSSGLKIVTPQESA